MLLRIAWRNLGRNVRRSLLTGSAVAFAVLLVAFAVCLNEGSYEVMIDNATRLGPGHAQVFVGGYDERPEVRRFVPEADSLRAALRRRPEVEAVLPRLEAFVVASVGARSVAARLVGVDPEAEVLHGRLPEFLTTGRWLAGTATPEAVIGAGLARRLGLAPGGELVLLGTDPVGSIAPMVAQVVGVLETGQAELDRVLVQVPLGAFREAFLMPGAVHRLALLVRDFGRVDAFVEAIRPSLPPGLAIVPWRALVPDVAQSIAFDRISNGLFYALLGAMVTVSVVNTFLMIVFERTREFGLVLALGASPLRLVGLLQLEALLLALLGTAAGLLGAALLVAWLGQVGLDFGEQAGALLERYHMPGRLYPSLVPAAFLVPPPFVVLALQLAALVPALRLRRLDPVEAMRFE